MAPGTFDLTVGAGSGGEGQGGAHREDTVGPSLRLDFLVLLLPGSLNSFSSSFSVS